MLDQAENDRRQVTARVTLDLTSVDTSDPIAMMQRMQDLLDDQDGGAVRLGAQGLHPATVLKTLRSKFGRSAGATVRSIKEAMEDYRPPAKARASTYTDVFAFLDKSYKQLLDLGDSLSSG